MSKCHQTRYKLSKRERKRKLNSKLDSSVHALCRPTTLPRSFLSSKMQRAPKGSTITEAATVLSWGMYQKYPKNTLNYLSIPARRH